MDSDLSSLSDFEEPPRRRRIRFIRDRENPFEILHNQDFKNRYRLDKETVMHLVHEIGNAIKPITRRNKSLDAQLQILIALRFYATGAFQQLVGDHIKVGKSTVCRVIKRVTDQIASLSQRHILMPRTDEEITIVKSNFYAICGFPRVIGALDCSHVRIQSPGGPNAELFRNRKGYFSINIQAVCDAKLKLRHLIARWPGSVHDSTIFNDSPLPMEFEMGTFGNGFLLGDSGYPCKPHLLTPLLNPLNASEEAYNRAHILTRNPIERFFGVLKRRFPCLANGLRLKLDTTLKVIVACAVLHNICNEQNDDFQLIDETNDIEQLEDNFIDHYDHVHLNQNVNYAVRNALIATVFAR